MDSHPAPVLCTLTSLNVTSTALASLNGLSLRATVNRPVPAGVVPPVWSPPPELPEDAFCVGPAGVSPEPPHPIAAAATETTATIQQRVIRRAMARLLEVSAP